ncbi:MAG TPA: 4,5-dihydroxyphthalate decarboxylase, partial [Burkholderiales bacterium]|nr:4,5-dihydroxyphthalate decarboxylase [Burkholderiales bacterium]
YDHVRNLDPAGIDLTVLELPIEEVTYRFTKFAEWDASELSFGKTVSLLSQPNAQIVPIPVFPSRVFRHSAIYVGEKASIKKPDDLNGKRVGVPEWAQTAGMYVRGMLAHEYGVDLKSIRWFQAGVREPGRAEKVQLRLPEGLQLTPVPDKSLASMLAAGELDAVISARNPGGRRLFPETQGLEEAYYRKTGIFPIMHVIALKRASYEANRWIAMNLVEAFEAAKRASLARVAEIGVSQVPLPWVPDLAQRWKEMAGEDFWPYGVEPNRRTLEAFVQYAHEQGVTHRKLSVDELFAPETRERAKV